MFGRCVKQLFYGFMELKADVGFEHISLSPRYIEGMGFLDAELKLPKGILEVKYRYDNGKVHPQVKSTEELIVELL